eukprot:g4497.t1
MVKQYTFKCAFKCAEITINGESRDVFKDPITDKGKASKKGRLTLQLASETTGFSDSDKYKPRSDANPVPGAFEGPQFAVPEALQLQDKLLTAFKSQEFQEKNLA